MISSEEVFQERLFFSASKGCEVSSDKGALRLAGGHGPVQPWTILISSAFGGGGAIPSPGVAGVSVLFSVPSIFKVKCST